MTITHDELTASEARQGFAGVVGRAEYAGETTYIVRHGKRVAAVVPAEAVELLDRIENDRLVEMAREARVEGGPTTSHDDLMREFGLL